MSLSHDVRRAFEGSHNVKGVVNKAVVVGETKVATVFLAQVLRYIHAAWPVASLC